MLHKDIPVGADSSHPPGYVQAGDPGAVGAYKVWIDTSGGTGLWTKKIRNAANTGWETVGASASHVHAAADITSGTVATARLGSGTADATKFLRGDQSWQVPGGGTTIQYPTLKPGTPTDDFAAASLDGAWSAHSSQGSFATTDCITQARDGSHLRMGFTAQMGKLYRAHANTDLDISAGGLRAFGELDKGASFSMNWGIFALDSAGTGVAIIVNTDVHAYLASITTWNTSGTLQTFSGFGQDVIRASDYWLRLIRVGNSWTGYVSRSGMGWGTVSASASVTITVDKVGVGMTQSTATAYNGALELDWFDV